MSRTIKLENTLRKYFYDSLKEYNSSSEAIDQMLAAMEQVLNNIPHVVGKYLAKELRVLRSEYLV